MTTHPNAQAVLDFWYNEQNRQYWFAKSEAFDSQIKARFSTTLKQAEQGELVEWRSTIHGRLAEIIVLDQFSRNLYRHSAKAFAQDGMALVLVQAAVALPEFEQLTTAEKHCLLLPYMHSESGYIHQLAEVLFSQLGSPTALEFEIKHKVIIDRFGRYPHRNAILGRVSTVEELQFLNEPNSSF